MVFQKGQSGNPLGINAGRKPDVPPDVKEMLKKACPAAINTIVDLAVNSKDARIRLAAAEYIGDKILGKAVQPIEGTGDELKAIIHRTIINDPRISGHSPDTKADHPVQCST
jgi:hypothetical protein